MRIMTNYLQILAAALAFNLNFPNYLSGLLLNAQRVGQASGIFLSFDCLIINTRAIEIFDNAAFFKVLLVALVPIAMILVSVILFAIWFFKEAQKFKRYTWVTVITVFFIMYPTLTQSCLRIFKCISIGGNTNQVEMDIVTGCWSVTHLKWIFGLGKLLVCIICIAIPMLVIYVIGVPFSAFWILYKNRYNLSKPSVLSYFLILYQGLKHEIYYWEIWNTLRKFILLSLHVFIPDDLKMLKALFGVFVLTFFSTLQLRIKPFKIDVISKLGKCC